MIRTDRPGIVEKVGTALASGNLTPREGPCSLDRVMALGMVGMEEKIADAVFRLKYANDPKEYHASLVAVIELARRLNNLDNWMMGSKLVAISEAVLTYWMADTCPVCTGKRADPDKMTPTAIPITGTPHLQDDACPSCQGSGKRPYPWLSSRSRDKSERCHTTLLVAIEEAERRIRDRLISKLANEIRSAS